MDAATALRGLSNSALAMSFGMCVQSKPGTLPPGAFATIADELTRRGLYLELLSHLGHERAGVVTLQLAVDRTRMRRAKAASAGR